MEQQIYVDKMTCSACAKHVSKALLSINGVRSAKVKHRKGVAVIEASRPIKRQSIIRALEDADYALGSAPPLWLDTNKKIWKDFGLGIIVVIATLFVLSKIGLLSFVSALDASSGAGEINFQTLLVIAAIGVVASVSSCMAVVGGVVLGIAATYAKSHPSNSSKQLLFPQLIFNLGRIIGFGALGSLLGTLGSFFVLQGVGLAILASLVSLVMLILGVRLTEISPRIATWQPTLPAKFSNLLKREEESEIDVSGHLQFVKPLLLGVVSFFLPCGFTQAVQLFAISTGNPLWSGILMATFAVGTTPGLLGISALTTLAKKYGARILHILGVLVIGFSLMNLNGAISPYFPLAQSVTTAVSGVFDSFTPDNTSNNEITSNVKLSADGKSQTATIGVGDGYSPKKTVLYAGVPTKLTFKKGGIGCASSINLSGLGIQDYIRTFDSDKTVDLNLSTGKYTFTCSMGMYSGYVVAIDR